MDTTLLGSIVNDLTFIHQYKTDYKHLLKDEIDDVLWLDYRSFWNRLYHAVDVRPIITPKGKEYILQCNRPNTFYWPLVQFFVAMPTSPVRIRNVVHNHHQLASYFSQISKGQVNKRLFLSAFYPRKRTNTVYLGLQIFRKISPDEYFTQLARNTFDWFWSKEEEMNKGQARRLIFGGAILSLFLGMFIEGRFAMGSKVPILGRIFASSDNITTGPEPQPTLTPEPQPTPTPEPQPIPTPEPQPPHGLTGDEGSTGVQILYFVLSDGAIIPDFPTAEAQLILNTAKESGKFATTQSVINQIIANVVSSTGSSRDEVVKAFKVVLLNNIELVKTYIENGNDFEKDFQFGEAIKPGTTDENSKDILIALIYAFQRQYEPGSAFGYMLPDKPTSQALQPKVKAEVLSKDAPPNP